MILGYFNFYRSLSNRNRDGGNMNDIMVFKEIISNLEVQVPFLMPVLKDII